jgi:hypothetical protein
MMRLGCPCHLLSRYDAWTACANEAGESHEETLSIARPSWTIHPHGISPSSRARVRRAPTRLVFALSIPLITPRMKH